VDEEAPKPHRRSQATIDEARPIDEAIDEARAPSTKPSPASPRDEARLPSTKPGLWTKTAPIDEAS